MFTENPFEPISDESFDLAIRNLNDSKIIIDTGFSVGETNKRNIDIVKEALKLDKKFILLEIEMRARSIMTTWIAR